MKRLVFGCGYLGERVAQRWLARGDDVVIVTRNAERAKQFLITGCGAIVADVTQQASLRNLPVADSVLFAVGYDRRAGQSIDEVYAGGMRNVLAALPVATGRFIYISTTGVYGNAEGNWVDEDTPPDPQREGGRASLAAEAMLRDSAFEKRCAILRLAGIYGPGRVPFLNELLGGHPIPARISGFLNLIHVEDAAAVVVAAGEPNSKPMIYCVSDGHPVLREEYYREVARRIGATAPRFIEPDPGSPRAARAAANRRVRNERMLRELGITLDYPNYRAGLAATLEIQNQ